MLAGRPARAKTHNVPERPKTVDDGCVRKGIERRHETHVCVGVGEDEGEVGLGVDPETLGKRVCGVLRHVDQDRRSRSDEG